MENYISMISGLFYEAVGDLYYHRYLRLRPGKSESIETGRDSNDEENRRQFNSWMRNGEALSDAIHRIVRLDEECRKAEAEVERLRALCATESEAIAKQVDEHSCLLECACDECISVVEGAVLRLSAAGRGEG